MTQDNTNNCNNRNKSHVRRGCKIVYLRNIKTGIFSPLNQEEIDFLIDKKRQITYNVGETITKAKYGINFKVICINEGLG